MSIKVIHWAAEFHLKGYERLVLITLAELADEYGRCYDMTLDILKNECGINKAKIKKALKSLIQKKIIAVLNQNFETPMFYLLRINHPAETFNFE